MRYFTDRNIQAILYLDSWMYTLSNPCSSSAASASTVEPKRKTAMKSPIKKTPTSKSPTKVTKPALIKNTNIYKPG